MRRFAVAFICLGITLILGMVVFALYYYPNFVRPRAAYQKAEELYNNGDYVAAALRFSAMSDYADSAVYTQKAWIAAGDAAFASDDLAQASAYYKNGSAGSEYFSKLNDAYYKSGVERYAAGDRAYAEADFSCISHDSELLLLLDDVRIAYAREYIARDDYETAEKALVMCSDASGDIIADIWLEKGDEKLIIWELSNASYCFAKAMTYTNDMDATLSEVEACWKRAGQLAESAEDYELAERCYAQSGIIYDAEESRKQNAYEAAVAAYNSGEYVEGLRRFMELGDYADCEQRAAQIRERLKRRLVAGGAVFYAVLEWDGSVRIHGDWEEYTAPDWSGIETLSVGRYRFMVGLNSDGTVVGSGNNTWGNLDISGWSDIVQAACGYRHTLGLRSDGTVVGAGSDIYGQRSNPQYWSDIVQIACGEDFSIGLRRDGTVVSAGLNDRGQCNTGFMENVVQIGCGRAHVVALKSDGTVYATGVNSSGQCNVGEWSDIVEIFVGANHTVGLTSSGTLVATGSNSFRECNVREYSEALFVSCGDGFTLIMLKDGTEILLGAINNVD